MSEFKNSLIFVKGCDNIEELKRKLEEYLISMNLKLISMKFIQEYGQKILQVLLDRVDETFLNSQELEKVNNYLSSILDELDPFNFPYMLEVSSIGAEKEIHLENLSKHLGEYVTINDNILGDVIEIKEDKVVLKQNQKGRIKKIEIPFEEINKIKLTIKI